MTAEEDRFFQSYPELHHYTSWGALQGMLTTNTLWATHYQHLNDLTEVEHMKEYLAALVPRNRRERRTAKREVESLYNKTFTQFVTPYIVSLSTHTADTEFDRENGLLAQWARYGGHGYAVVFDTKLLNDLLNREFEAYQYTQTTYSNVVYNFGVDHFRASFAPLISEAAWFIWDKPPLPKSYARAEQFISDFSRPRAASRTHNGAANARCGLWRTRKTPRGSNISGMRMPTKSRPSETALPKRFFTEGKMCPL
jgi:hypothetical protein